MKSRLYEIDLYRFVAAALVVVFHYTYTAKMEGFAPIADFEFLRFYSRYTYVGINFFFIISGFVIYKSVEHGSARRFVASRFSRLFPAYWSALLLTSLFTLMWGDRTFSVTGIQFLANIPMTNELFGEKSIDSAYWTLYIELKFYLIVFSVLLLGKMKYFEHIIAGCLVTSLLALFLPWAKQVDMFVSIFPHWSGYFSVGAVFYLLHKNKMSWYRLALLILSYLYVLKQSTLFASLMGNWFKIEFNLYVTVSINTIFFGFFCITVMCKDNILRKPYFYYIGILTYPLYLIHQHIGYMVFNTFGHEDNIAILVFITSMLMLAMAFLIWRYIERPLAYRFKNLIQNDVY